MFPPFGFWKFKTEVRAGGSLPRSRSLAGRWLRSPRVVTQPCLCVRSPLVSPLLIKTPALLIGHHPRELLYLSYLLKAWSSETVTCGVRVSTFDLEGTQCSPHHGVRTGPGTQIQLGLTQESVYADDAHPHHVLNTYYVPDFSLGARDTLRTRQEGPVVKEQTLPGRRDRTNESKYCVLRLISHLGTKCLCGSRLHMHTTNLSEQ